MSSNKTKQRVFLSVTKVSSQGYFEDLYNSVPGMDIPGPCKFCGQMAWHLFEETSSSTGEIEDSETNYFLCCDRPKCLARAMPEIFEKFRKLLLSKTE